MTLFGLTLRLFAVLLLLLSVSCAGLRSTEGTGRPTQSVAASQDGTLLGRFAPVFILEDTSADYNRIGTPAIRADGRGRPMAYVDPRQATIYSEAQVFERSGRAYTNLIYRIHFEKTPLPHLTAGKNVGLIVIVTLGREQQPLLLTTVHTCGCYLAFVPTSLLARSAYPDGWSRARQTVYGESLPGLLELAQFKEHEDKFAFRIRGGTHRVMAVELVSTQQLIARSDFINAKLLPMSELRSLSFGNTEISFFATEGPRKGYVRNSHKPLERLLMSWWAFDWRIGEDKDLGPKEQTGTTFYTSLKIWARAASDLWEFNDFLDYWGWDL